MKNYQVIKTTNAILLCLLFCVPSCLTVSAEPILTNTASQTTLKETPQPSEDSCQPRFSSIVALFSILKIMDNQFLDQTESDLFSLQDTHSKYQKIKSMSSMAIGFGGFDPSKEGANLILKEEKGQHKDFNKDLNILEETNNHQSKIITSIMDIAIGFNHTQLPKNTTNKISTESSPWQTLQRLVGTEEAERILSTLDAWQYNKTVDFHTKQVGNNVESNVADTGSTTKQVTNNAESDSAAPNTGTIGSIRVASNIESNNNVQVASNIESNVTDTGGPQSVEPWTINQQENYFEQICQAAIAQDPIIIKIKEQLHQYNTKSELSQNSTKTITTTLGIAGFVPTIVAPIAGVTSAIFTFATGGPEQEKLLKELYLSKCLESRLELIRYKARVILSTYLIAKMSNNLALLAATRGLLEQSCLDNNNYIAQANVTEFISKLDTCLDINTQQILAAKYYSNLKGK